MKKSVVFGGVLVAAMGAFLCTGCGDKLPTVQELYNANANITDTVSANVTVNLGASSDAFTDLVGSSSVNISGTVGVEYASTGVAHVDGTVSAMGESMDVEAWIDNDGAYVYDADFDYWYSDDTYAGYMDDALEATTGLTGDSSEAAKIQSAIDDKNNTTASLTKTDSAYVLTYAYALSDLANDSDMADDLGDYGSMLSSLSGNMLITTNYDLNTMRVTAVSISLDDAALSAIESLASAAGVDLDITQCSVSATFTYSTNALTVPDDAKNATSQVVAEDTEEVYEEPVESDPYEASVAEEDTLFYQIFGYYEDEYDFQAEMTSYADADYDLYDSYVTYIAPDGTECDEIDVYWYVSYMYSALTEYSDVESMAEDMEYYILMEDDPDLLEDGVERATAYINILGMLGDEGTTYLTQFGNELSSCQYLDASALSDCLLEIADELSLPTN